MSRIGLLFCLFGFVLFLAGCSERVAIINGVDEREANEIVVFLASKGINADKQPMPASGGIGGASASVLWNIYVEPSQITEALSILNRNGLPRRQGQNLLQIFGDSGLVPTDMQQKIRYQAGLSQQIANTIRQIDGVIDATVQLSFPEDEAQPFTAAVYVKHQGVLDNPNSQLVTKIKQLVAGSVAGLKLDNVTVISDRSRFTDVSLASQASLPEDERDYVSIWGVIVSRNSVGLFRLYFFLFSFLIIILVLALLWVIWKCLPYINSQGGLPFFWDLSSLKNAPANEPEEEETPTPPPEK